MLVLLIANTLPIGGTRGSGAMRWLGMIAVAGIGAGLVVHAVLLA